jgi:hypothetical protein
MPPHPSPSQRHPAKRTNGASTRRWSADVMRKSNALDLEPGVFKKDDPHAIAESLKRSAEVSKRRKSEPLRSAMSMLNFFINRAGRNMSAKQRAILERAKDELRALFGRTVRRSR